MRRGHTLLELTLVLAILGLAFGITLPRLSDLRDGLAVDEAARAIVTAHRRARVAAILRGRLIVLTVGPDSLAYRVSGTSTGLWRIPGPSRHGVAMLTAERQVTFSPVGLTVGAANASYHLLRGQSSRTVVVSRLGRLRVTRP